MFFLERLKKKDFKKRANLSGQIMPFLLIIIAIFLGAFFATAKIGSVAINMTCADNAADACALAAASHMAYMMNLVHKIAPTQEGDFNAFQQDIKTLSDEIDENYNLAKDNVELALNKIQSAIGQASPGSLCTIWDPNKDASENLDAANTLISDANLNIITAYMTAKALEKRVKLYKKDSQYDADKGKNGVYCNLIDRIKERYDLAKTDGVKYGLENNCVYPNLSSNQKNEIAQKIEEGSSQDSQQQQQAEDTLGGNGGILPINDNREAGYDWKDSKGYDHSMGADVTLPKLASIELEVTKMNEPCDPKGPDGLPIVPGDPYGIKSNTLVLTVLTGIEFDLMDYSVEEKNIYIGTVNAVKPCWKDWFGYWHCCSWKYWDLTNRANNMVNKLNQLVAPLSNSMEALQTLIEHNKEVVKALGPAAGTRIVSSFGCEDAGDVIIIGIHDVKFESGCVDCQVGMAHAGSESTGRSYSSFGGGSLSTSSNNNYIPGITKEGCPGEGGVTSGTTMGPLNHMDEGCN